MTSAVDGSTATQSVSYGDDDAAAGSTAFETVLDDTGASVPDETTASTAATQTEYEPIPWKPTSEAGVAQGASAGDDPGFGSVEAVQSTFVPGTGSFDWSAWKLTIPVDLDGDGDADEITEDLSGYSSDYFMQNTDGSVWMTTGTGDLATTENSSYGRTELRGMINPDAGDKDIGNNMVLSTASAADQEAAGAVDGTLTATMSVDQVSETGDPARVGRTVIGQIHSTENEPLKLYYRKHPDNEFGSIFFSHESADGKTEDFYDLIGSRSDTAENPIDGIALGEEFNYTVDISGDSLTVSVVTEDGMEYAKTIDISESGYDAPGEHMYFKAGAYDQNNTALNPEEDHVDVTFSDIATVYGGGGAETFATEEEVVAPAEEEVVDPEEEVVDPEVEAATDDDASGSTTTGETTVDDGSEDGSDDEVDDNSYDEVDDDSDDDTESVYQEAYDAAYEEAYDAAYQENYDRLIAEGVEPDEAENQAEDIAENEAEDIAENEAEDAAANASEDGDVDDSAYQDAYDAAYEKAYDAAYKENYDRLIAEGVEPDEAENQAEDIAEDIAENEAEDAAENATEADEDGGSEGMTDSAYQNAYDAAYDIAYQEAYEDALADGLTPAEAEAEAAEVAAEEAEDAVENGTEDEDTDVEDEDIDVAEDAPEDEVDVIDDEDDVADGEDDVADGEVDVADEEDDVAEGEEVLETEVA